MVRKVYVGDSASWLLKKPRDKFFSEIPSGAELKASIKTSNGSMVVIDCVEDGDSITCLLKPDVSKNLDDGRAILFLTSSSNGDFKKTIVVETFDVVSILSSSFDGLSMARKCYEQARQALATFTSTNGRVKSYTIGSRSTTYNSVKELVDLVNYWALQVKAEEEANSGRDPFKKLIEFV